MMSSWCVCGGNACSLRDGGRQLQGAHTGCQVPHYRSLNEGAAMDISDHSPVTAVFTVGLARPTPDNRPELNDDDEYHTETKSSAQETGQLYVTDFAVRCRLSSPCAAAAAAAVVC